MPPGTSVRTFIEAIQTGQTNTTKALDAFFTNPGRHQNHPRRADFRTGNAFDRLPGWARTELQGARLIDLELAHIDSWPNDQKDRVRDKLDEAIEDNRNVHFFWMLDLGETESVEVIDPDSAGDITIVFHSPGRKVRQAGPDIFVDV